MHLHIRVKIYTEIIQTIEDLLLKVELEWYRGYDWLFNIPGILFFQNVMWLKVYYEDQLIFALVDDGQVYQMRTCCRGKNQPVLSINNLDVLLKMSQTRIIYDVHLSRIYFATSFHIAYS